MDAGGNVERLEQERADHAGDDKRVDDRLDDFEPGILLAGTMLALCRLRGGRFGSVLDVIGSIGEFRFVR